MHATSGYTSATTSVVPLLLKENARSLRVMNCSKLHELPSAWEISPSVNSVDNISLRLGHILALTLPESYSLPKCRFATSSDGGSVAIQFMALANS